MDISKITNSKVCIVCSAGFKDHIDNMVFIVDLKRWWEWGVSGDEDEPVVVPMIPDVRLDAADFKLPAICVLGSKLYVVEHYFEIQPSRSFLSSKFDIDPQREIHRKFLNPDGKAVFTYELDWGHELGWGLENTLDFKLDKTIMRKEPVGMNHTKVCPKAAVTPDGNILVFSSIITCYRRDLCDFELYDSATCVWHNLPNLPIPSFVPNSYSIEAQTFTFLDKNVFFLRTDVGVFALDLDQKNKWVWKKSGFPGDQCMPSGNSFVVIGKQICLIPPCAYDIRVRGKRPRDSVLEREDMFATLYYKFPSLLSFPYTTYSKASCGITLLEHQEEEFTACLLHTGVNNITKNFELMLQVYNTNLPECLNKLYTYKKEKREEHPNWRERKIEGFELPGTSKVKSIKFVVLGECLSLGLCSFSSLRI